MKHNAIYIGDCRSILPQIESATVDLGIWSPPYLVGKSYEQGVPFSAWLALLQTALRECGRILKPGAFVAVNIADILCFPDPTLPRIQAEIKGRQLAISRATVIEAKRQNPQATRRELAAILGCSEQTIQRRLETNNVRGGKYTAQTRVVTVGGYLQTFAAEAGLVLYDRRVWVKDPAWANNRWHSVSYRAVDEFEYVYVFWKPGITTIDRKRLAPSEWRDWGSRGVWKFPSVRANNDHEAKFPIELPSRLIRLLSAPGDLILDPFIGSGTTAIAARRLGRDFIGIELLPQYAALAEANLKREVDAA